MSDEKKTQPTHRVSFAAKRDGQDELGRAVEIGAIWPRTDPEKEGGILRFDVEPKDLSDGVLFVRENRPREKDSGRER
ncbi:MAG: hypothetical protein MJE66_01750 [Proteobacteria bacterium]|nr:hypothetical protein [Pseudomonadota bacterium]